MLDIVKIKTREEKHRFGTTIIVFPEFRVKRSKDIMFRGKSFYAVWDEKKQSWEKDEYALARIVDDDIMERVSEEEKYSNDMHREVEPKLLLNFSSNKWNEWQKFCKSLSDNYHQLDSKVLFSNDPVKKENYATFHLPYPLKKMNTPAYEELMSTLYEEEERQKIEWVIGSIISGDSKKIQKFLVLYGGPGTGKSTVINIIQDMFEGYWGLIDAKELTGSGSFALESLKDNPLIAIQHDADLSRIEDNSKLNSVVSHEKMVVNEKFKSKYDLRFHSFLIMGTNKPIKITDTKSGVIRRLIDAYPTGKKIPARRYQQLMDQIKFEHAGIAYHCLEVYKRMGINYYDSYIPQDMLFKTNDLYNFVEDNLDLFLGEEDGVALKPMWRRYKEYCEDANIQYPMSMRTFRDEIKNYFEEYKDRVDGKYSVYYGFLENKFKSQVVEKKDQNENDSRCLSDNTWIFLRDLGNGERSKIDEELSDCLAQYAKKNETPSFKWEKCKTKLSEIDPEKLHYVKVPENMIVIDFDLKDEKGEKSLSKNLEAAGKFPPTYAEVSKGGQGIHLHYYYGGNPKELSRIIEEDIEVKVFTGNSSLRRKLSLCDNLEIATLMGGLPLKEKKMIDQTVVENEKMLRALIEKALRKEVHANTKPNMDFIFKILDDAYKSGIPYDVRDMRPRLQKFAMDSTHQSDYCMKLLMKMEFCSEESREEEHSAVEEKESLVFFDVEVFPNLLVVVWKKLGPDCKCVKMINPSPEKVEELCKFRLVGFNNRKYDNHILYSRMMGYSEGQVYKLSQSIIGNDKEAFFGEAYNLSYTDIYDFLSPANKMSLKKWELKLGIHHQELGLPWDKPVPKELWEKVSDYCENDVIATEAVWLSPEAQADFKAREILADWAEMSVNTPTNTLAAKIIFGNDRNPQQEFVYTDLSTIFPGYRFDPYGIPKEEYDEGAKIVSGKSIYRGEDPSEGGKVNAKPGIYLKVGVLDIISQHPHSIKKLKAFGNRYTKRFVDIVDARKYIKHKDFEKAKSVLPEKVHKYLDDPAQAKGLAGGLKGVINPVYGLTSAKFPNKFKDPRNVDNIVAKYGALFMIDLRHAVEEKGWTWVHIKTDSIKIADITEEKVEFVKEFGEKYGFEFEYEAKYSKMCLVNESTYIAEVCEEDGKPVDPYWTATGAQFQIPYVFKTLFSKEPLVFEDFCEIKSVTTAMYLDFGDEENHDYRFVGKVGEFCPVLMDGGILVRSDGKEEGKYSAVVGTKKPGKNGGVYRWLESEMVRQSGLEDQIDKSYYRHLVDEAIETIEKFGDFEQFVNGSFENDWMKIPETDQEEIPFEECMNGPKIT